MNHQNQLDSLHWFSQCRSRTQVLCAWCVRCDVSSDCIALFTFCVMRHDSAKRHIFGGCRPRRGAMTPKFELGQDCCAVQVSSSYVYSFGSYRVDTQTNPQTNRCRQKHPTFFAMLRRWVITKNVPCLTVYYSDWLKWVDQMWSLWSHVWCSSACCWFLCLGKPFHQTCITASSTITLILWRICQCIGDLWYTWHVKNLPLTTNMGL